jgi:glycosyltransferase involved in cell wall biosynthesis
VGCPVSATGAAGGGPRYVTGDGKYGVLVPRGDRTRLAEAMQRILDPRERAHYHALGRERVEALSPTASGYALIDFLSQHFGL